MRARILLIGMLLASACGPADHESEEGTASSSEGPPEGVAPPLPSPGTAPPVVETQPPPREPEPSCAADMVLVRNKLCVDRYEAVVVDDFTKQPLSPYYPPEAGKSGFLEKVWRDKKGTGTELEQRTELPVLPAWQKQKGMKPRAVSQKGRIPQAYASGKNAEEACRNAGKRLCLREEWRMACRGQEDRDFPYGDHYEQGKCNTVRETHPGVLLWENAAINHTDPRFNLLSAPSGPLLRRTGGTPSCASRWGDDAIYDMVGNVDEWIDDPEGTFLGAFYARGKKDGCQSAVETHVYSYADYSTGIRCCADPQLLRSP